MYSHTDTFTQATYMNVKPKLKSSVSLQLHAANDAGGWENVDAHTRTHTVSLSHMLEIPITRTNASTFITSSLTVQRTRSTQAISDGVCGRR